MQITGIFQINWNIEPNASEIIVETNCKKV